MTMKHLALQLAVLATAVIGFFLLRMLNHNEPIGAETLTVPVTQSRASVLPQAGTVDVTFYPSEPKIRMTRWGGEATLSIRYPITATAVQESGIYKWKTQNVEVHAYLLEPTGGMEDGGLEFELVLNKKPSTNVFTFLVEDADNLDFFYQPPLTPEEIAEGGYRPDNIVGSYAVYHKTKRDHIVGQPNYATGKAFHIYRPKAIDANSIEQWGTLSYSSGIMTVTIPQQFLNTATYPVRVDPTFGNTTLGSTTGVVICSQLNDVSQTVGQAHTLSVAGTLDSLHVGGRTGTGSEVTDTFLALYDEDSAGPGSHDLIASVETLNVSYNTTIAWVNINAASESLAADTYIIAGLCNGEDIVGINNGIQTVYDTGSTINDYLTGSSGAGSYNTQKSANPMVDEESSVTQRRSLYATYTPLRPRNANVELGSDSRTDITDNARLDL